MAGTANKQFRPISDREAATNDGQSIRGIRDTEIGLNNYSFRAGVTKVVFDSWPTGITLSADTATVTENVRLVWAQRYLPDGPNRFAAHICGKRILGAGGVGTTVRIYCAMANYVGPEVLDTNYLTPGYKLVTFTKITSNTPVIEQGELDIPQGPLAQYYDRDLFFLLTMENDNGGQITLTNVDITPLFLTV